LRSYSQGVSGVHEMLFLQRYTKDNPTKKKIIQWQDGLSMFVLLQVYGDWLEGITGERV